VVQDSVYFRKTLYVSNVSHSSHLAILFGNIQGKKYVMMPWIPSHRFVSALKFFSKRASRVFDTRASDRYTDMQVKKYSLGLVQFYAPLKLYLFKKSLSLTEARVVNFLMSIRTAWKMRNKDLVILTRDIFPNIRKSSSTMVFVEMREHHPKGIFREPSLFPDYPVEQIKIEHRKRKLQENFASILKNSSGLITYSEGVSSSFSNAGYPAKNIFVIPLKYPSSFKGNNDIRISDQCLFVGRDDLSKGLDFAVAMTYQRNLKLMVVGHFSIEVIGWLSKFSHVKFLGYLNRNSLKEVMLKSTYLIAPSVESFGLVTIEALELGCIVVSSKMNGAAYTFRQNPNVYCSESLNLEDLLTQLDIALKMEFDRSYLPPPDNTAKDFSEFVQRIKATL
jgi:glycosyltransferase involved in cell wall biosynthesis